MKNGVLTALAAAALLAAAPAHSADSADTTWDGLQKVSSKQVDEAYLLPGADFRGYDKVLLDPIDVSFRRNWERDMNRSLVSARPRVSAKDADEIRSYMAADFREILARDLARAGYEVVDEPGPDVLRLTPVLLNVYINAPDTPQAGRIDSYTLEAGEATLAIEARDSETHQLLGRAVDRRRTGETGSWTWTTRVTNRAEFNRVFGNWSSIVVGGLAALKDASPIKAAPRR